ncbi:MAG: ATP-dependent DNA helicase RecQ, partial [Chloroflexota bacterium]
MTANPTDTTQSAAIAETMRRYWGYNQFRPLQVEAIEAALAQQDSLVVLPTGGGKSLCYAVPPVVAGRTDVVVSPLIALMKDQVDGLQACGYPAAAIHSGLTEAERQVIDQGIRNREYRLLFVAPERLLNPWFMARAKWMNVQAFAIDEAHCISHWGHDFRPEYRRLSELKTAFPQAAIHAYTATATDRVRQDIIEQLGLQQPRVLVGRFDRPNLVFRIIPKRDVEEQALTVVRRHPREAVIIYCISRADTERLAESLRARGVKAGPYHAGLDAATRSKTQEAFAAERLDVVVATVAFGMGIDRSNVRCVVHAALPKSVEQYQQETGRAGRDGLEAECVLLYSPDDARRWESLLTRPAPDTTISPENLEAQLGLLADMQEFASSHECRHAGLSGYFSQPYEGDN